MSFLGSPFSNNIGHDDYEFDEDLYDEYDHRENDDPRDESDEDTEDASETDAGRRREEPVEMKEQIYQVQLAALKKKLQQLRDGCHADYNKRCKRLELMYRERQRLNQIYREYMIECVERDYVSETRAASKEFDDKKIDLRENLLSDFEDKRKTIEAERYTMELAGDSTEVKPAMTRKLRRRPNDPVPVPEKRRKAPAAQIVYVLDDKDVDADLKIINRGKPMTPVRKSVSHSSDGTTNLRGDNIINNSVSTSNSSTNSGHLMSGASYGNHSGSGACPNISTPINNNIVAPTNNLATLSASIVALSSCSSVGGVLDRGTDSGSGSSSAASITSNSMLVDTRVEDGKLSYERRWFHRGQSVYVEGRDLSKFAANIAAITPELIWVKKTDGSKVKILLSQLAKGKVSIKRRAS